MSRYTHKLIPPYGTVGFHHQIFKPIWGPNLGSAYPQIYLEWRIDAYIYMVGTLPNDHFEANGGAVFVALVHGGSARTGHDVNSLYEYRFEVTPQVPGLEPITQLPPSSSGIVSGDDTNYPISFSQDMQMFRQNGTEAFTFTAQYESSIGVDNGVHSGLTQGSGVRWGTRFSSAATSTYFPFGTFSLFRADSLRSIELECTLSVHYYRRGLKYEPDQIAEKSAAITIDIPIRPGGVVAHKQRGSKL